MLLDHVWGMIDYWDKLEPMPAGAEEPRTQKDRMSGLAFSILSMLDGSSMDIPAFLVTPMPHESDKEYHQEEGTNWFPEDQPDLGMLHEHFGSRDPRRRK